jgi:hypothetical protein
MKKQFILLVYIAILLCSCKKKSTPEDASPYFIKATIDGVTKTFNANRTVTTEFYIGIPSLLKIKGYVSSASQESLEVSIAYVSPWYPVTAGSYSETDTTKYYTKAIYQSSTGLLYEAGHYPNPPNPLQVTVTTYDIHDPFITQGTFSGDVYYTDPSTGAVGPQKKTIANGSFYLSEINN